MACGLQIQPMPPKLQRVVGEIRPCRHVHHQPYATVVLEGGYEEAGEAGRFRVSAGDVLFHTSFSAHLDRFFSRRTVLLNLPLPHVFKISTPLGRIAELSALVRASEKNVAEGLRLLETLLVPTSQKPSSNADNLALALREDCFVKIVEWSSRCAVRREVVSREFRRLYGTTARAYRAEARARRAWSLIRTTDTPMAHIAFECGFADQPHMTRAIRALTGAPPTTWRPTG